MAKTPSGKNTSGRGQRDLKVKVKSARGRKLSSTRWLQRQLNDPYVKRAQGRRAIGGARPSRSWNWMKNTGSWCPGARVVDLGLRARWLVPGGREARVNALGEKSGQGRWARVIGVDLQEVEPIAGCGAAPAGFPGRGCSDEKVKRLAGRRGGRGHVGHGRGLVRATSRPTICASSPCVRRRPISPLTCWMRAAPSWPRFWQAAPKATCRNCSSRNSPRW